MEFLIQGSARFKLYDTRLLISRIIFRGEKKSSGTTFERRFTSVLCFTITLQNSTENSTSILVQKLQSDWLSCIV